MFLLKSLFYLFLCIFDQFCTIAATISIDELKSTFGDKFCIQGSLLSLSSNTLKTDIIENSVSEVISPARIITTANNEHNNELEKSSLSALEELVQFNEIKHYFELKSEEGPDHSKIFRVSLVLGDEEYEGKAGSLKKAKQHAALQALEKTQFQHPPIKIKEKVPLTPTVTLNNIGNKLAIPIRYFLVTDDEEQEITNSNPTFDERPKKTYLQKLNASIYNNDSRSVRIPKESPQISGPFQVKVKIGGDVFRAFGHTIQSARHNAALKAIKGLKMEALEKSSPCLKDGLHKECRMAKDSLKSPISLVVEAAQQQGLEAIFEIIEETGPSHKKIFITQCRLADLTVEAEGTSKKESKRAAAEKMVAKLSELPPVSDEVQIVNTLKPMKKKKNKKKKIIKNNVEKIGLMMEEVYDSIMTFGGEKTDNNEVDDSQKNLKKLDKAAPKKSAMDEILELSNSLNFEIQFTDIKEDDSYFSLLSLDIKPPYLCLGEDATESNSREKAATAALKLLYTIGFSGNLKKMVQEEDSVCTDHSNVNLYLRSQNEVSKELHENN